MKILITGANGFVGKNLTSTLQAIKEGKDKTRPLGSELEIFKYDVETEERLLDEYCAECDCVVHLAGVNRPTDPREFMAGNYGFTVELLETLKKHKNKASVILSSSVQAELDNEYGKSKRAGEELLREYGRKTGAKVYIYRYPNLFGKWCRPNYNSVVATFCHNIAHGLDITVSDREKELTFAYIDDVVSALLETLAGTTETDGNGYAYVKKTYKVKLGRIADLIRSFKENRNTLSVPDMSDEFTAKLYATYLSYLPKGGCAYALQPHCDARGSFTEILRTRNAGQFSVNVTKPGVTKGEHWHHTKNEKFLVVSGKGVIRLRNIFSEDVEEYCVSGEKPEVVDIPAGYTHNIENLGETDMITFMWCSECFDPEKPDTYYLKVKE